MNYCCRLLLFHSMTMDTFSLNVIGVSTKFISHVIVLQSSPIEQPSLRVWDIPEHELICETPSCNRFLL